MPRIQEALRSRGADKETDIVELVNREILPVLRAVLREVKNVTGAATTITSSTYLTGGDWLALVDATSGAVTVTLPEAASWPGKAYVVKKTDSSGNAVTVSAQSAETIDGASTASTSTQYATINVVSDGFNWYKWK